MMNGDSNVTELRAERGPVDYDASRETPAVERRKPMIKRPDWLAVGVAILSILTTLGAWVWWGGRLSQRVETLERSMDQQEIRVSEQTRDNAKQDIALGVTGQQYADIIRRLGDIDRKLDQR